MSGRREFGQVAWADLPKDADGTVSEASMRQALGVRIIVFPANYPLDRDLNGHRKLHGENGAQITDPNTPSTIIATYPPDAIPTQPSVTGQNERSVTQINSPSAQTSYIKTIQDFHLKIPALNARLVDFLNVEANRNKSSDDYFRERYGEEALYTESVRRIAIHEPSMHQLIRWIRQKERKLSTVYGDALSKIPLPSQNGFRVTGQKLGELAKRQAYTLLANAGRIFTSTPEGEMITDLLPSLRGETLQDQSEKQTSGKTSKPIETPTFPTATTILRQESIASNQFDLQ